MEIALLEREKVNILKSFRYRLVSALLIGSCAILASTNIYAEIDPATSAANNKVNTTDTIGDAKAGQQKSTTCQGCHGVDGNAYADNWPNLAAQHSSYLNKQIHNFQSGKRKDATMSTMVIGLTAQDIADISAYFSQQKLVVDSASKPDANLLTLGKKIYKGGNLYSGMPACGGCHGPNGVGISPAKFPVLAGQKVEYLIKTLKDFRNATRNNDPRNIMRNIAAKLTDNEIKSVATYINSLSLTTKVSTANP